MDGNAANGRTDGRLVLQKKKTSDGHHVFSLRLRDDMVTRLDEIAARTERSRNKVIVLLLEWALEHCEVEEDE